MVSLQSPLSRNHRTAIPEPEKLTAPLKRKTFEGPNDHDYVERQVLEKRPKAGFQNFMADIELHLETPLPSEWQRCLDIKSGEIHFYNTKTHTKTSTDPRKLVPQHDDHHHDHDHHDNHTTLDLELNLTTTSESSSSSSFGTKETNNYSKLNSSTSVSTSTCLSHDLSIETTIPKMVRSTSTSPSWLALEADRQEMVATVCMRCHMLVMLCRSSPACPNCKFVHPTEKSPSNFVQVKL